MRVGIKGIRLQQRLRFLKRLSIVIIILCIRDNIMKNKSLLILPLLLCSLTISGCNWFATYPPQGIWEATDITLPNLNVHIDSLKIVVTAKLGLPYGDSVNSHSTIYNYSIWWNDTPIYDEEDEDFIFGVTIDHMHMFYWKNNNYSAELQGDFKKTSKDTYTFEGYFWIYDENSYVPVENAKGYYALRDDIDNLTFSQIAWEK